MARSAEFPFRIEFPPELPISARAEEITAAIRDHAVLILAGETGSGKTTQIPKLCLAAGRGFSRRIACTQPRRVAALSISRRVAEEVGAELGREVGCKVRFSDQTSAATRIKFLTDGMLLSEAQGDPLLSEYDTIIVDEAHERSLNIDFLLGHLRQVLPRRPDLKVIVTSATIDTAAFSEAFGGAPVIVVQGRTFPVEVVYAPLDSFGSDADPASADDAERAEALHYVDGAVEAVDRLVNSNPAGDILVFLPSERDVREVRDLLEGRVGRGCELVPLFGRLSNAEQQRVFAPSARRKIVVATNIAETSLTIPGIRFVVDTGLARISRYSPQARTRRLPIEPISQSSADQRKGRCGRVAEGLCVRLFSEADYQARPKFTQPEIQRANLADVILRLKAFAFGEVEEFPFLSPPAPKAIRAGYAVLEELGALAGPGNPLTAVGRELARLPVDPTVGRMILQAREEKAVREVLAIAAALSVQDPRERPLEAQAEADRAHRRFAHPDSDFLSLLNIWEAYHEEMETLSQGRLRRFCREHFLSYTRMREWRDVHGQLAEVLGARRESRLTSVFDGLGAKRDPRHLAFGGAGYRAIHRSLLAGLLGNIAVWDEANGGYRATHDRRVALFPGSSLYRRPEPRRQGHGAGGGEGSGRRKPPAWILAGEIVETTRVYARTCARLDPAWALDLAAHLVKVSHSEPFWDAGSGRVRVKQKSRLYGLEIDARAVGYGKINPGEATDIFIREALVGDGLDEAAAERIAFLKHNRALRERVASALTRARYSGALNLDEALYRFYRDRLGAEATGPEGVSSVAELLDLVRRRRAAEPRFLFAQETDLHDPSEVAVDPAEFPPELPLENRVLPLQYHYRPGQEDDGVTLEVGLDEARRLTPAALDWAVPGYLTEKVEHYLRALPKELRRTFVPLGESARNLASALASRHRLTGGKETVAEALAAEIRERHRLGITAAQWAEKPPPDHLRVRVRVRDEIGRELLATREVADIERLFAEERRESAQTEERAIAGRLRAGLRYELAWLERDLGALKELGPLAAPFTSVEQLRQDGLKSLEEWLCDPARGDNVEGAKADARGLAGRWIRLVKEILELRQELLVHPQPYPGQAADVERLVGADFLRVIPFSRLAEVPRYLKAMKLRAERWRKNPGKDAERANRLAPYAAAAAAGKGGPEFRWLVEEFRVSVFAQELGTAGPISSTRLDELLAGPATPRAAPRSPAGAPPAVPRLSPEKKPAALKSLSGLDQFFSR